MIASQMMTCWNVKQPWVGANFLLQFMLDTSLSDAEKFPLKMADLGCHLC